MSKTKKHAGVIVPMVSPLNQAHQIDEASVEKIISNITGAGAHPFVLGTTGEALSLTFAARKALIDLTVKYTRGARSYVGVSANCFDQTVELAQYSADKGVDAIVAHLPSYYPLDEDHILRYFEKLLTRTTLPIFLYNIPVTTHISIPLNIIEELSSHPRIVGLKDSERGEDRLSKNLDLWKDRPDFSFVLGWAAKSAEAIARGADGTVPSSGNLIPGHYCKIYEAASAGHQGVAQRHQEISDAISAIYQSGKILVDMIPALKYMLHLAGLCTLHVKTPMVHLEEKDKKKIHTQLTDVIQEYQMEFPLITH